MRLRNQAPQPLKLSDIPRYETLLQAVERGWQSYRRRRLRLRDLALMATLVFTGCRIGEAVALQASDVDFTSLTVRIHQEKKKGTFIRVVPVPRTARFWDIMREYVPQLPFTDSRLFPVTTRQARNIVYEFTERYLGRRVRPHAIRHSYAVFILKHTRDLEAVRRLLGHADYRWLRVYLDYSQEDLRSRLDEAFRQAREGYGEAVG